MTGLGPDGQIDYYLDANGNKHIRWYGMPRSSTGVMHAAGDTLGGSGPDPRLTTPANGEISTATAGGTHPIPRL